MNQVLKKIAKVVYYLPSNIINKIQLKISKAEFGKGLETKGILYIKNKGTLKIGRDVRFNSSGSANPIGGGNRTYFQILPGAKIVIGDNTRISNCAITSAVNVEIGNNVRIGAGVKIYDTDFHSMNYEDRTSVPEKGIVGKGKITISDYAFIGAHSIVLKGVCIGKHSVIGAGSVITKSVPDDEIWGGNPARFIKKL